MLDLIVWHTLQYARCGALTSVHVGHCQESILPGIHVARAKSKRGRGSTLFSENQKEVRPRKMKEIKIKRTQRPHACSQCDAAFGKASNLRTHVRTMHEQRRDHACPQCDATFGEARDLSRHVRTVHEKRKDHACPQCDAAFGKASDLRRHVRTVHEQRRDHACSQCDAAFGQASDLRTHVRTVHEQRRDHACPQCDAAFGAASTLRKHVRTVHKCSPCKQQLGDAAPGISHALLNLV